MSKLKIGQDYISDRYITFLFHFHYLKKIEKHVKNIHLSSEKNLLYHKHGIKQYE